MFPGGYPSDSMGNTGGIFALQISLAPGDFFLGGGWGGGWNVSAFVSSSLKKKRLIQIFIQCPHKSENFSVTPVNSVKFE